MDILKIGDDSLKVMLTADDLILYSLDYDILNSKTEYSMEVLKEIIRDAGEKCGFDSDLSKLFVQLYASSKGECEIYAKRISDSGTVTPDCNIRSAEYRIIPVIHDKGIFIYSFDEMENMIHTCNRLTYSKYKGDSTAYKDICGRTCFLLLEEKSPFPEEFGGQLCGKNVSYYIHEHCSLICSNAVSVLGNLA